VRRAYPAPVDPESSRGRADGIFATSRLFGNPLVPALELSICTAWTCGNEAGPRLRPMLSVGCEIPKRTTYGALREQKNLEARHMHGHLRKPAVE
jgi:hypothetical protein